MQYRCDECGACCRQLLVEAYEIDVLREPRLVQADPYYARLPLLKSINLLKDGSRCCVIAGPGWPCLFLENNRCSIYPTRPNDCVAMSPGEENCHQARIAEGLPPLQPSDIGT